MVLVSATVALVALTALSGTVRPASADAVAGTERPVVASPADTFTFVVVTWNSGTNNISKADQPSAAFLITPGETAHVEFSFRFASGSVPSGTSAQLQLTYLGLVLTADKVGVTSSLLVPGAGNAEVNFSFGPLYDALEGVFQVTASLLSGSGGSLWSESFYIFAKAPYYLASAVVVVLLLLVIAESYWIASGIREARRGPRAPGAGGAAPPPPPPPPPAPGAPGTPPPAGPSGPSNAGPGAGGTPPASGGST